MSKAEDKNKSEVNEKGNYCTIDGMFSPANEVFQYTALSSTLTADNSDLW